MTTTFTPSKHWFGKLYYFLWMLIVLPFAAQSQNNKLELEQRMNDLYVYAKQLHADLPVRDYRGHYFNAAFGTSPFGHIKTWHTENVCDCEGNVVDTKNVTGNKAPISASLGFETRLNPLVSMRLMGNYAHLSHGRGRTVVAENSLLTTLQQNYEMTQLGAQGAALLHFNNFYGGAGIAYASSKASGFQTVEQVGSSTPPQYFKLKADVLKPNQTDFAGNIFVGYQMVASAKVLVSLEMGIAQKFYANVQLNFPLSSRANTSLSAWQNAYRLYQKVRKEAVAIDMYLHPAKFQTDDSCNTTSSSNSCPR